MISKKKKVFTEIQRFFSTEIRNSRVFFRPNTGDLQTKKRSSAKFKRFFWPKSGDLQRIGLHRLWVSFWTKKLHYSGPNNGKSFTTSVPNLFGRAVFIFGAKIGFKSTRNVLFCTFFRPIGEVRASLLATLQVDCRQQLYSNLQYIFCLFVNSEQTHYFKIGKFCLFMMSRLKLNVKWQVTQTGGQSGLQLSSF